MKIGKRGQTKLIILSMLLLSVCFVYVSADFPGGDYESAINGDMVGSKNSYFEVNIFPHTSNAFVEQCQYINIIPGLATQDYDLLLTYDNEISNPDIWVWKNAEYTYGGMDIRETSYTCPTSDFNYTISPNWAECLEWYSNESRYATLWEGEFNSGDIPSKTVYYNESFWNPTKNIGYKDQWISIKDKFSHATVNGTERYWVKNQQLVQNNNYTIKWCYNTPPNSNGKWSFYGKRSIDTLAQALSSGNYIMIDPWWNASCSAKTNWKIEPVYTDQNQILFLHADTTGAKWETNRGQVYFVENDSNTLLSWMNETAFNGANTKFSTNISVTAGTEFGIDAYYDCGGSVRERIYNYSDVYLHATSFEEAGEVGAGYFDLGGGGDHPTSSSNFAYELQSSMWQDEAPTSYRAVNLSVYNNGLKLHNVSVSWQNYWDEVGDPCENGDTIDIEILQGNIRYTNCRGLCNTAGGGDYDDICYYDNNPGGSGTVWQDTGLTRTDDNWDEYGMYITDTTYFLYVQGKQIHTNTIPASTDDRWRYYNDKINLYQDDLRMWRNYTTNNPTVTNMGEEIGNTAPFVEIKSPLNNTYFGTPYMNFTYNVSDADIGSVVNCSFFINKTEWLTNFSVTQVANQSFNVTNLSIGVYNWSVGCFDGSEWANSTEYNLSILDLNTAPFVEINFPLNNSKFATPYINFTYNVSDADAGSVVDCSLFINKHEWLTNFSVTQIENQTFNVTNLTTNSYNWSVGCYDGAKWYNSTEYNITIDVSGPSCYAVSVTPSNIEANSTGTFELIVNCTDMSGINTTKVGDHYRSFYTTTVDDDGGTPNQWHIFYPDNNMAVSNDIIGQQVLRATGRNESYWYEDLGLAELDADIYTYAVYDGEYNKFKIQDSGTTDNESWALFNISGPVEMLAFKQSFPLSIENMQSEEKKEYNIYKNNHLMVLFYDLERMKNVKNYLLSAWGNFNYTLAPNKDMEIVYCNQSHLDITCGGDFTTGCTTTAKNDNDNCVYLNALPYPALNTRKFSSKNSSYVGPDTYGIIDGKVGGIETTNISYIYYSSVVSLAKGTYTIRYANGTTDTNIAFNDSGLAFFTTDAGSTYSQLNGTPDIFINTIKDGDQFQLGGCAWDLLGNEFCDFAFLTDDIGIVNFTIGSPHIQKYLYGSCTIDNQASCTGTDDDKNGTHSGNMSIHINMAIDPDSAGNVSHNLTLVNEDGTYNYTINTSFQSYDDSDLHIIFYTNDVADGQYKLNISAYGGDDMLTIKSFTTEDNFTIDNTGPTVSLTAPANNTNKLDSNTVTFIYQVTDTSGVDNCALNLQQTTWSIRDTDFTITEGIAQIFTTSISNGAYNWSIGCYDGAGNQENSSKYNLTVNAPLPGGGGGGGSSYCTDLGGICNVNSSCCSGACFNFTCVSLTDIDLLLQVDEEEEEEENRTIFEIIVDEIVEVPETVIDFSKSTGEKIFNYARGLFDSTFKMELLRPITGKDYEVRKIWFWLAGFLAIITVFLYLINRILVSKKNKEPFRLR